MKKLLMSIAIIIMVLSLAGCGSSHTSSYSAIGTIRSNTNKKASLIFHELKGRMVFTLKAKSEGDIKYSAKLGEGSATVYYEQHGYKQELFTIKGGETLEDEAGYIESGKLYLIIETDGKCKSGDFSFNIE